MRFEECNLMGFSVSDPLFLTVSFVYFVPFVVQAFFKISE